MAKQTKSKAAQTNEKRMKLTGHLKELRNRLIVCLLFLFVGTIVGLGFAPRVVEHLLGMGEVYGYQYVYLAPQELLMQYMSVALIFGLVCAMPVIMYEVWAFARPGLSKRENIAFVCSLIFGTACFCAGVYFAYRIMLPTMLGPRATIPANRMMEMPLPMPNSVICSPSHIRKAEPATKAAIMTKAAQMLSVDRKLVPLEPTRSMV